MKRLLFSLRYYATMRHFAMNCTTCRQFIVSHHNAKKLNKELENGIYNERKERNIA